METGKISFGFNKNVKKTNPLLAPIQKPKEESKVELIKCLEGKEIKLIEEKVEEAPLVIPMKDKNQKTSSALLSLMKRRAVLLDEEIEKEQDGAEGEKANGEQTGANAKQLDNTEITLEQRAARELLAAVGNQNGADEEASKLVLPVVKPDDLPLDGAKESTLNDYDSVPIQQFGMAMLRGMGWVEPPKKKGDKGPIDDAPLVRPKGMGLGADKALKKKPLLVAPESNEDLRIKRNAYVRILGGKYKDLYGQIEGFDDFAGRVIVKMAIGGNKEAFNEFLCQPVARKEYADYGKCINTAKYEEYKRNENNEFTKAQTVKTEKAKYIKEEPIDSPYKDIDTDDYKKIKDIVIKKERMDTDDYKKNKDIVIKKERMDTDEYKRNKDIVVKKERMDTDEYNKNLEFKPKSEFKKEEHTKYKQSKIDDMSNENRRRHNREHDHSTKHSHGRHNHEHHRTKMSSTNAQRQHDTVSADHQTRRSRSPERHRHRRHDTSTSSSTSAASPHKHRRKKSTKQHRNKSKHRRHRDSSTSSTSTTSTNSSSASESKHKRHHRSDHKKKHRKHKKRSSRRCRSKERR